MFTARPEPLNPGGKEMKMLTLTYRVTKPWERREATQTASLEVMLDFDMQGLFPDTHAALCLAVGVSND